MSEQPAETTGAAAPAGPRQFTPEELEEARQQLMAQGELSQAEPAQDQAALGMQALADGAQATEVDPGDMLAMIKSLQAKVAGLEAEKRLASAPDVVRLTTAVRDHLAAKAAAHPQIQLDPDHTWKPVLDQAGQLVHDAEAAADAGHPGSLGDDIGKVASWVTRHAKRFPHIDYGYILELAEDAAEAAAKLAA